MREGGPFERIDIYRNPEEVVWKFVSLDAYFKVVEDLKEAGVLTHEDIHKLHIATIDLFNSSHNRKNMCARTQVLLGRLEQTLAEMGKQDVYEKIRQAVSSAAQKSEQLIGELGSLRTPATYESQTRIDDGEIVLAGQPMEKFASQDDYLAATLQLFGERDVGLKPVAEESFLHGFQLSLKEFETIREAQESGWDMVDLTSQLLLDAQKGGGYASLSTLEYQPTAGAEENQERRKEAIRQAYYFMGKIMRSTAIFATGSHDDVSDMSDPVNAFLQAAGKNCSAQQVAAVRKIALAHSSHGLNSGELTAQLAGSVRTTFPRALIASFNIRSGILHAGAVKECMDQTRTYLQSSIEAKTYVASFLKHKELLYGFGHRIHKTAPSDGLDELGKDPRVAWYIQSCLDGFPEKHEEVEKLVAYAQAVRELRPSLGANTDFGAAVLFHTLGLSANVATGFFAAFRSPGLCAQIVNELSIKGNSRRPPFPPVLPYPTE